MLGKDREMEEESSLHKNLKHLKLSLRYKEEADISSFQGKPRKYIWRC